MLGKLIKYDLKAVYRLLIPLHLVLLLISFFARLILTTKAYENIPMVLLGFGVAGYIILIVVVIYTTIFLIIRRFYKNLFSDEGYLTWTLPVTPHQHLLAKTISGTLWMLFDYIVIILSLGIVFLIPSVIENSDLLIRKMDATLQMSTTTFFTSTFILGLVSVLSGITFYYVCIALGQLFSTHRVIAAFAMYFALSTVISVIIMIILIGVGIIPLMTGATYSVEADVTSAKIVLRSYDISIVLSILQGVLSYIGTLYIMKKKVNLE